MNSKYWKINRFQDDFDSAFARSPDKKCIKPIRIPFIANLNSCNHIILNAFALVLF